jgi:hypothetical protein
MHTLMQVLKQCGDDLTRANVMRQVASLHDVVVPGISINTSPTRFAPINQEHMVASTAPPGNASATFVL